MSDSGPPERAWSTGGLRRRLQSHRTTLGDLTATLLGGVAVQLTLVATGIILARALGPVDRGYLALLTVVWAIAMALGALGLPYALTYGAARIPGRAVEMIAGLRRAIGIRLVMASLLAAVLLAPLTIGEPGYVQAGALIAIAMVAPGILQQCGLAVLQGLQKFRSFNVLRVAPSSTFALAGGVLLLADQGEFIPLTVAWGASAVAFTPVIIWVAGSEAKQLQDPSAPTPPTASWILRFGRRSMLGASPPIETYRVDQAVVALFLAPVSLGLYVVALAFTNLPRFIAQAVGMVANPLVASSESHPQARRRMWKFCWAAIPLYLPVIAVLWIAAPQLTPFFFGSEFSDAAPITRLLLIATALFCARRVLGDAALGAGYPLAGSVAELVALIAVIPLFAVFVPGSGTHGVAYALIAASAIALAVQVGMLLNPRTRGATPSGWFETVATEQPGADPLPRSSP